MSCENLCFECTADTKIVPIEAVLASDLESYLEQQTHADRTWIQNCSFAAKAHQVVKVPDSAGGVAKVVLGLGKQEDFWSYAGLPKKLPAGCYKITAPVKEVGAELRAVAWQLGCYYFSAYKFNKPVEAQLCVASEVSADRVDALVTSTNLVRDLVNTPAEDMGPEELAAAVAATADELGAEYSEIVGKDLLTENYPMVYAVGMGAARAPRLAVLTWGDDVSKPLVALVGKGVCFDTGGLQLKGTAGILDMKKDMGGAAHAIALARLIIKANLPVRLRLLVPCVENAISGSAYRPRDILTSRDGQTVEVNNTDAEGRLILADALTAQVEQNPDVLINFATLTGAGKVALGPDVPVLMTNTPEFQDSVCKESYCQQDLVWPLPLYAGYKDYLDSDIADMSNVSNAPNGYGGSITAGLFLQRFVPDAQPWIHFDIMAANVKARAGRPRGGEAQGLRTMFAWLEDRYKD